MINYKWKKKRESAPLSGVAKYSLHIGVWRKGPLFKTMIVVNVLCFTLSCSIHDFVVRGKQKPIWKLKVWYASVDYCLMKKNVVILKKKILHCSLYALKSSHAHSNPCEKALALGM